MRSKIPYLLTLLFGAVLLTGLNWPKAPAIVAENDLADVLVRLGDTPLPHQPELTMPGVSADRGRELVLRGITEQPKGGLTSKQSKHFVCTSCHNIQREDPDLSVADPQARLEYALENGLPYLQGTTLYGAVNRTNFYNGDYEKKYGELVVKARNSLREAIQLCAIECSQGRRLKPWELESVLAFLWTIDLKLSDLQLTDADLRQLNEAVEDPAKAPAMIRKLKSLYLPGSPATFAEPPADRRQGYAGIEAGDPKNGRWIYELSCKHCHEARRYSFFALDDSPTTFRYLKKHFPKYTRYSVYQVGRYGTSPLPGKHAYMPNYTLEKLSDQQLEDLRAYIEEGAR